MGQEKLVSDKKKELEKKEEEKSPGKVGNTDR